MPESDKCRHEIRVIVDTALNAGAAEYANLGDIAMLQVGIRRLQELWPDARIHVLTDSPGKLAQFCPGAIPLPRAGRDLWVGGTALIGNVHQFLPEMVSSLLRGLSRILRLRFSALFRFLLAIRLALRDRENTKSMVNAFLSVVNTADLFVECGAGGFTDSSRAWSLSTLNTLEEAIHRRIPAVMLGQGLGPLSDPEVIKRARHILPDVALITLRGTKNDTGLAKSLGFNMMKVTTTGDEAIELAYEARAGKPGEALGINLRLAGYSEVDKDTLSKIGSVLQRFVSVHRVELLPVPIAFHEWANDPLSIRELLAGFDDRAGAEVTFRTPQEVIEQISRCKLVVTGAYHGAVFALAQGIPVVALSASEEYAAKFQGLKEQFGLGCEVVLLNSPDLPDRLATAIDESWQSAERVRLPLQEAAERQVKLSRDAYRRTRDMITSQKSLQAMACNM
ncbi:MAG: polysaccharide pyruvyl transferase family protein [Ktedonobacteraceae bacterium]|nr:polysaccharide pyruvyl transferase family protein [Ktedonobacteraceae bacterium]